MRLERHSAVTSKEQNWVEQLNQYWVAYQKMRDQLHEQQRVIPDLEAFRWMLEEYRISLFAQTIKTRYPISYKRLDKFWGDIQKQVAI